MRYLKCFLLVLILRQCSEERSETVLFNIVIKGPRAIFVPLRVIRHYPEPLALRGPFLVASDAERVVYIVNVDNNSVVAELLRPGQTDSRPDVRKSIPSIYW